MSDDGVGDGPVVGGQHDEDAIGCSSHTLYIRPIRPSVEGVLDGAHTMYMLIS